MKLFDTIAAIATPQGYGGVAIIRISGENSQEIADRIVRTKIKKELNDLESHKLVLSDIYRLDGALVDEALVSVMRAPHSYTGETVVEINCHGGFVSARQILEELIKAGARLAEAGEFTRRAFINGKTDLAKAEAVNDIIHANSKFGLKNAAETHNGKLSEKVNALRDKAVEFAAHISAAVDFPEEIEAVDNDFLIEGIDEIDKSLSDMISGYEKGKMLRDGIHTAIVGRPNVGKSSVLNALAGEDRAIVTDIPGTTRDIVEEYISLGGISLRLVDTAGIRESSDKVEQIGIERAKENIKQADLCLFVVDSSEEITEEDIEIAKSLDNKNVILLLNKQDKGEGFDRGALEKLGIAPEDTVLTSTPEMGEATGIDDLEKLISKKFIEGQISSDEVYISSERQKEALLRAKNSLDKMRDCLDSGMPADLVYVDLEDVISALGEVTGETVQEEIIDTVFSKFCVGK